MSKLDNFLAFLFLCTWGISFGFLYRDDLIYVPDWLGMRDLSELLSLLMMLTAFLEWKKIKMNLVGTNIVFTPLFFLLSTTFIGAVLVIYLDIRTPYLLSNRLLIQLTSLIASVFSSLIIVKFILDLPAYAYKSIWLGFFIAVIGVGLQYLILGWDSILWRLHGIHGEPKALSLFLAPFIVALILQRTLRFKYRILVILLSLSILLLTYSVTGFLAVVVGIIFLSTDRIAQKKRRFAIGGIFFVVIYGLMLNSETMQDKIFGRLSDRLSGEAANHQSAINLPLAGQIVVDFNDAPVVGMLLENPLASIFGVGYGLATFFSYPFVSKNTNIDAYTYTSYITPNLAILNNITNFGLVMTIYLFFLVRRSVIRLRECCRDSHVLFIGYYFSALFYSSLLIYSYVLSILFSGIILILLQRNLCIRASRL